MSKRILTHLLYSFFILVLIEKEIFCTVQKIQFKIKDGVIIVGNYSPPSNKIKETFVLLHGLGSTKEEWNNFVKLLQENGYGFCAFDLRGHGESVSTLKGEKIDYKYFGKQYINDQWSAMINDLGFVINFLVKNQRLDKDKIIPVGASLGANICFLYTTSDKEIPCTILLSPGWDYMGLKLLNTISKYGKRPILICASPQDYYSYSSSKELSRLLYKVGSYVTFFEGEKNQHGVQMFNGKLEQKLIDWINKKL